MISTLKYLAYRVYGVWIGNYDEVDSKIPPIVSVFKLFIVVLVSVYVSYVCICFSMRILHLNRNKPAPLSLVVPSNTTPETKKKAKERYLFHTICTRIISHLLPIKKWCRECCLYLSHSPSHSPFFLSRLCLL